MNTPGPSLLDPEFIRELEALRRRLEIRARSGSAGERASRRRGGTAEFQEHRAYTPGDDLRRVDWLAFARTGEPMVKLFRAEEDAVVRLLVDASSSLDFGDPPKIEIARRLAAAFGYLALAGAQRAQVLVAQLPSRDVSLDRSTGITRRSAPRRGRGGTPALLRDLVEIRPGGAGDLARAVDQVVRETTQPGLLAVISDFLDPGPVTQALSRARSTGHDVALVQILERGELEPPLEGDYSLEDCETGQSVEITADASAIEAYVLRVAGLIEELRSWSRTHGASYVRVINDERLDDAVRRFVARGID